MLLINRITKICLSLLFLALMECSCSKSSTSTTPTTTTTITPPCTTNTCILTGHKWEISSFVISTDAGVYTYPISFIVQLSWATFTFRYDSSYICDSGDHGAYQFTDSTSKMILYDNLLPLNFNVGFPTKSSLILSGDTVYMHPRRDMSIPVNFAINSTLPGLHDDFGVDTSRIKYFISKFSYNGY